MITNFFKKPTETTETTTNDNIEKVVCEPMSFHHTNESRNESTSLSGIENSAVDDDCAIKYAACNTRSASPFKKSCTEHEEKTDLDELFVLSTSPNQPRDFNFPQRLLWSKRYRFQSSWFTKWNWIHYVESNDSVLCWYCAKATLLKLPIEAKGESAFTATGFTNWVKATDKKAGFNKHEQSRFHRTAVNLVTSRTSTKDIGETLSSAHHIEMENNRKMLIVLLSTARYLARQNSAFRGHEEESSNFLQLLHLRCDDVPGLKDWLEKKSTPRYTSPQIQNEMIRTLAHTVLRDVVSDIKQSRYFAILADETTDSSNKTQLVVCLRYMTDDVRPQEDFIGLCHIERSDAATISQVIKDVLIRLDLPLDKCRAQCYDGCSTMAGSKSGVAATIKKEEPRALFTHCYGHALNLACGDTVKRCKLMKDALDTAFEITKLVKLSPKRESQLKKITSDLDSTSHTAKGLRILCPTRWTVRAETMERIIENYIPLNELWTWAVSEYKDTETKARVQGVMAQMTKFDFFFGLSLGICILGHADSLSSAIQSKALSACQAKATADMTVKTLASLRCDESWRHFWEKTKSAATQIPSMNSPKLPRKRRAPLVLEECIGGKAPPEYFQTEEAYYRRIYYEALDLVTTTIVSRFDQPDFAIYMHDENVLLSCVTGDDVTESIQKVVGFFNGDFTLESLTRHLQVFAANFRAENGQSKSRSIVDVFTYLQKLSSAERSLMSEVTKVAELLLVAPATNATSERSFSILRLVKQYLRSTMTEERLNHLMTCSIYKDRLDKLNLQEVANSFISGHENRMHMFGLFK